MSVPWIVALCAVVGVLAYLALRRGAIGGRRPASVATLKRRLGKLVHDPEVGARLVEAERRRHPELGEAALLRKVIRRLERDRS